MLWITWMSYAWHVLAGYWFTGRGGGGGGGGASNLSNLGIRLGISLSIRLGISLGIDLLRRLLSWSLRLELRAKNVQFLRMRELGVVREGPYLSPGKCRGIWIKCPALLPELF